ncbi:ABC transporter permease [Tardiphaga sp.]|uniref:ABC transporter permease n=1 Tax=Tardiphaga sp. TaxID=1926292 RepID=UPI00262F474B|nr:ABC transporter permease [Tardiphaga sp.]
MSNIAMETKVPALSKQTSARTVTPNWLRTVRSTRFHSVILLIVLLLFWQYGVGLLKIPKFILPPFSDVVQALYKGLAVSPLARDGFWFHSFVTLTEVLGGFFIGSAIGLVLGMIISESQYIDDLVRPYIAAFQSLPKVAIAPIIVMWMGYGMESKIAIVVMLTFFPVLVTSIAGFKAIETDRIDLLRSLSATRWQIFRKVKFPSALPYIFAGLDVAAAFAVVGAIVGEFVGAQSGLGVMILQMDAQLDTGGSFAVFLILASMGVLLTAALRATRRRLLSWMPENSIRRPVSA